MTISSQRKSAIIEDLVDRMHARIQPRADAINQDGHLPGTLMLPGKERLDFFYARSPSFMEWPLLWDSDYELRIREGLDTPPTDPYWFNMLSIPGMLKEYGQDFHRLVLKYADAEEVVNTREGGRTTPEPVEATEGYV